MSKRKKEYFYDQDGNKYEVGPSFIDMPMGVCISCPICRACKNQIITLVTENAVTTGVFTCKALGEMPEDVKHGRVYQCSDFEPDESSRDYELVKKLMNGERIE